MTIPEEFDFSKDEAMTLLPQRSRLIHLRPMSQNTWRTESLRSYFIRLALAHGLPPTTLARLVVVPELGRKLPKDPSNVFRSWRSQSLVGIGDVARQWSQALARLTLVKGLDRHTLLPLRGRVADRKLLESPLRWCPECLLESMSSGQAYSYLLWEISFVRVCPKHRKPLVSTCPFHLPKDNHLHPLTSRALPYQCWRCGGFLGYNRDLQPLEENDREVCVSRLFADLLESHLFTNPRRPRPNADIANFLTSVTGGLSGITYRKLGVSKSLVTPWLMGRACPTISLAVRLAELCGSSLEEVLTGNATRVHWTKLWAMRLADLSTPPPKPIPDPKTVKALRAHLQRCQAKDPPPSLSEVARCLHVDRSHLRRLCPDLVARLQERRKSSRDAEVTSRRQRKRSVFLATAIQFASLGLLPTRRRISQALPGIPIFSPADKRSCDEACQEARSAFGMLPLPSRPG